MYLRDDDKLIKVKLPESKEDEEILKLETRPSVIEDRKKERKMLSKTELALNYHNLYTFIKNKFEISYHESRISI